MDQPPCWLPSRRLVFGNADDSFAATVAGFDRAVCLGDGGQWASLVDDAARVSADYRGGEFVEVGALRFIIAVRTRGPGSTDDRMTYPMPFEVGEIIRPRRRAVGGTRRGRRRTGR
jgi:hypothetical protein